MKWIIIAILFASCSFTKKTGCPGNWTTVQGNQKQAIAKWRYSKWIKRGGEFMQYRVNKYAQVIQKRYWND